MKVRGRGIGPKVTSQGAVQVVSPSKAAGLCRFLQIDYSHFPNLNHRTLAPGLWRPNRRYPPHLGRNGHHVTSEYRACCSPERGGERVQSLQLSDGSAFRPTE